MIDTTDHRRARRGDADCTATSVLARVVGVGLETTRHRVDEGDRVHGATPGPIVGPTVAGRVLDLRHTADLEAAYRAHAGELERFVTRQLRDHSAAADVVQEVFVRAWRHAERYDPEVASLRVWLFGIARNAVIDHVRAAARRPSLPTAPEDLTDMTGGASPGGGGRASSDGDAFSDDMVTSWFVEQALRVLSHDHRHAIVETYLRGRPYAEVAAESGVPVGTLRSRVFHGLRHLRGIVSDMGVQL